MVIRKLPAASINIAPIFNTRHEAESLRVIATYRCDNSGDDAPILVLQKMIGNVPMVDYDESTFTIKDDLGTVTTRIDDEKDVDYRHWYTTRKITGPLIVSYVANARKVSNKTPAGPREDLRKDQGGLQACIQNLLPHPRGQDKANELWIIELSWDLDDTPPGTRAVWSFGEGPTAIRRTAPIRELLDSYIFVGPVQGSLPSNDREQDVFGFYWFGNGPARLTSLIPFVKSLFLSMSEFFHDEASASNPYRIFLRRSELAKHFGGTAFTRSYVLEYNDEDLAIAHELELSSLLSHEMVHNWPKIADTPDGLGYDDNSMSTAWYGEGIAEFYSSFLPYYFGDYSNEEMLKLLNEDFAAYYTNPSITMTNKEASEQAWTNTDAILLPYMRGMVFHTSIDARIRAASNNGKSVEDITLTLLEDKKSGRPHGEKRYRDLLEDLLGSKGIEELDAMLAGKIVVPPTRHAKLPFKLSRHDLERFELGFEHDRKTGLVTKVSPKTRAAEAGLRVSDTILSDQPSHWTLATQFSRKLKLQVTRGNEKLEIEYWPRTFDKVQCWQWEAVDEIVAS